MKIIQSYWSYPINSKVPDKLNRSKGGWLDVRFNLMSWALSCLTLKRFYPEIELITDTEGKKLLIDFLELPYSQTNTSLNKLTQTKPNPNLWALGKIYAYQQQQQPFLHIDGDVFLWQPFEKKLLNSPLIFQNKEVNYPLYKNVLNNSLKYFEYIPNEIQADRKKRKDIIALNAGIIGGRDISFFKDYTKKAFFLVNRNKVHLNKVNSTNFNMVYEQYLCFCMAEQQQKEFSCLFPKVSHTHIEILKFHLLPNFSNYIHVAGYAKRNPFACEQVEARLAYEFPDYYQSIDKKITYEFPDSKPITFSEIP